MRTPVAAAGALLLLAVTACSSSSGHHRGSSSDGTPGVPSGTSASLAGAAPSGSAADPSLSAGASGGLSIGPGGTTLPAGGATATDGRTPGGGAPGSRRVTSVLPATTHACRLLTQSLADAALRPHRTGPTTNLPGLCAYASPDGKYVVNIGDVALARGQSADGIIRRELSDRDRTGYRVTRILVAGRYPGVLEDGRPYVARVIWVQRGRNLTLTVSPSDAAAVSRTRSVADAVGRTLGPA